MVNENPMGHRLRQDVWEWSMKTQWVVAKHRRFRYSFRPKGEGVIAKLKPPLGFTTQQTTPNVSLLNLVKTSGTSIGPPVE